MSGNASSNTYLVRAQQCSGPGDLELERLYMEMLSSLQDNIPFGTLDDLLAACDILVDKSEANLWEKARLHQIRGDAFVRKAVTALNSRLIDTAREHYKSAKTFLAQAAAESSAQLDKMLLQCDNVEEAIDRNQRKDSVEPGYNGEQVDLQDNGEGDSAPEDNSSGVARSTSPDAPAEIPYNVLVRQCFDRKHKRVLVLPEIYDFVGNTRSPINKTAVRNVLTTRKRYENVGPMEGKWQLTDRAWAELG